jgi:thiol-disulfide isomerase/thioredoxin
MLNEGYRLTSGGRKILIMLPIIMFLLFAVSAAGGQENVSSKAEIYFFHSTSCPHCINEKEFLEKLEQKYVGLKVNYIIAADNWTFYEDICRRYNTSPMGVPRTFIGDKVFAGYNNGDCDLVWYESYGGYLGCPNQIEAAILRLLNESAIISKADAMEIAKKTPIVRNLTAANPDVVANIIVRNDTYLVAWWTPKRISSNIDYPDVLITVDARTGAVLNSSVPDRFMPDVLKPAIPGVNYFLLGLVILILIVPVAFMVYGKRMQKRYWVSIMLFLLIIFFFAYVKALPSMDIVAYAKHFSFPIFTIIIALVDGFNPCAFAVLAFLLSILTHTKSRKKMLLMGVTFILTSGFMYFLFIIGLIFLRVEILGQYKEIIRFLVALVAITAGAINIKDFFFFKQGISLSIPVEKQGTIFKKIGKLVRALEAAQSKKEVILAVAGTMALAAMVNLVELGCTFILPMEYIEALLANHPKDYISYTLFTAVYSLIYIIPLFAILASFIYSFKSERVTEQQGKILKLAGGLMMVSIGLALIFKPELLTFG